jgi:4-carboxymuconolactone decarboxylase
MARIEPIPLERMTGEQRELHDLILAQRSRGKVQGPFAILLHAPDMGARVADMVQHLLGETRIPLKLKELAILCIARRHTAQYEWFVHENRARGAGLSDAVIEALRGGETPAFPEPDEALIFAMVEEIVERRKLSDARFAAAIEAFGEPATVELIGFIGFYIMIAVLLTSFDVEAPDGAPNPLPT